MLQPDPQVRARAKDLLRFIDDGPSPWHVVATIRSRLLEHGFLELDESQAWSLETGRGYFVARDGSSLVAFIAGRPTLATGGYRIIGAHTDSPCLRVKPKPSLRSEKFVRIGVEVYGSPILATWTDRDLSVAGRICLIASQGQVECRLLKVAKPLLRLPNLAIHMNRTVNEEGLRVNPQNELPLLFCGSERIVENNNPWLNWIGAELGVEPERVCSWDLAVFDTQKCAFYGAEDEFFAGSRIDNLASCHAALLALLSEEASRSPATPVCAFFDHEEIGSQSQKGANGSFLSDVLERIALAENPEREHYLRALARSFLISADMAHAFQPNFASAYDPEHPLLMNQGPAIKINVNQRYSTESLSHSQFAQLCMEAEVPWQRYSHRNDLPCGSTIGPMTSARLGIRSVDVGCPLWAMHSIRESAGVQDHGYMIRVMTHFFARERCLPT
ncbi:MAG: M18 family aminopeptidase [Gammaproteobacteria bacterium]